MAQLLVMPPSTASTSIAPTPRTGFLLAWFAFWALLLTVSVQEHLSRHGPAAQATLWQPFFFEGTSFLVACAILALQWRHLPRHDAWLHQPWRWFGRQLVWLPLVAVLFVVAVYALRHGGLALLGLPYSHAPWPAVFRYETVKFGLFYLLFVAILFGIRSHLALSAERLRAEHALALSRQAQLIQLTQQIEPHFLFNALNTIAACMHGNPDLADRLLIRLSGLLRAATNLTRKPQVSLAEELELLEAYTAIMVERFRGRVVMNHAIDPATLACPVPTLSLQPLLENAFRHGVERRTGLTSIVIRASIRDGRLRLVVEDDAGQLSALPSPGVGLSNLRERLACLHGDDASLSVTPRAGGGVIACLELPCAC